MFWRSLSTGFFLASRQVRRASIWTNVLIIFVMTLTFLNLVVVSGILVGLISGSSKAFRSQYSGDIMISNLPNKTYIENTTSIVKDLKSIQGVKDVSVRYLVGASAEANYRERKNYNDLANSVGAQLAGIDPIIEDRVTNLSNLVVEGSYLDVDDNDEVLIGSSLLRKYSRIDTSSVRLLENISIGSRIRLKIGEIEKEVVVKGIVKSKNGSVSQRIYLTDTELRKLLARTSYGANEIVATLDDSITPEQVEAILTSYGYSSQAAIDTWREAQGQFFKDLESTFALLANVIGSIALAVASITIFIVIFINAITRRKYIGILKGIGINGKAIEISYIFQSFFYAIVGTGIGLVLLFFVLKPYFDIHPIDFPFSDGILVAEPWGTTVRVIVLFTVTAIAGYIPARLVVRQNTLDAILGR